MPWGDRTGPRGMGAMSGRAAGYCAGYDVPGYMNPGPGYGRGMAWGRGGAGWGRGMAWGRGGGRGWRNMYYATGQPGWARFGYAAPWGAAPAYGAVPPGYGAPPTSEQELSALQTQAEWLQGQIEAVNQRISELEEEGE